MKKKALQARELEMLREDAKRLASLLAAHIEDGDIDCPTCLKAIKEFAWNYLEFEAGD